MNTILDHKKDVLLSDSLITHLLNSFSQSVNMFVDDLRKTGFGFALNVALAASEQNWSAAHTELKADKSVLSFEKDICDTVEVFLKIFTSLHGYLSSEYKVRSSVEIAPARTDNFFANVLPVAKQRFDWESAAKNPAFSRTYTALQEVFDVAVQFEQRCSSARWYNESVVTGVAFWLDKFFAGSNFDNGQYGAVNVAAPHLLAVRAAANPSLEFFSQKSLCDELLTLSKHGLIALHARFSRSGNWSGAWDLAGMMNRFLQPFMKHAHKPVLFIATLPSFREDFLNFLDGPSSTQVVHKDLLQMELTAPFEGYGIYKVPFSFAFSVHTLFSMPEDLQGSLELFANRTLNPPWDISELSKETLEVFYALLRDCTKSKTHAYVGDFLKIAKNFSNN